MVNYEFTNKRDHGFDSRLSHIKSGTIYDLRCNTICSYFNACLIFIPCINALNSNFSLYISYSTIKLFLIDFFNEQYFCKYDCRTWELQKNLGFVFIQLQTFNVLTLRLNITIFVFGTIYLGQVISKI